MRKYRLQVYVIGFVVSISVISIVLMNILLAWDNKRLRKEITLNRDSVVLERINVRLKYIISKIDSGEYKRSQLDKFSAEEKLYLIRIFDSQKRLIYDVSYFPFSKKFKERLNPKKTSGELPSPGDFFFYRYSFYLSGYIDTLVCFYPIFDNYGRVKYYIYYVVPTPFKFPSDTITQLIAISQLVFVVSLIALFIYFLRRLVSPYENIIKEAKTSNVVSSEMKKDQDEVDFVLSTFRGIIARLKEKELELKKMHEKERNRADTIEKLFRDFIEGINIGIFTFDDKGIFLDSNSMGLEVFGKSKIYFKNKNFEDIFKGSEEVIEVFKNVYKQHKSSAINFFPIGDRIWRISLLPYFSPSSEFNGVIAIFEDVTEIRRLKERLEAKEQLSQMGQMSAGIAHEFKNSLSTISGYLQMFGEILGKGENRKRYDFLMKEVENLNKIVTDFLDFSRPLEASGEVFNVCEVVEEVIEKKEDILNDMEILLEKRDCFEITGDRVLFMRSIENLIQNSIESFLNMVGEREKRIEISIYKDSERGNIIKIKDNGIGIDEKDMDKIFTPFFTTKSWGVGLGLALVRKIVVSYGGDVEIISKKGEGTEVNIIFFNNQEV